MNNTIHQFWMGGELDILGLMSAKSIIKQGHELSLWSYDKIEFLSTELCLALNNANKVLDLSEVPDCAKCPYIGRPYEQIVSEFFRYKVLHKYGGWWLDNDIVLLNKLFWEYPIGVRGINKGAYPNVIYVEESNSQLMLDCFNNLSLTKWNASINVQLFEHKIENWKIPDYWFGKECNINYFRDVKIVPPRMGVHLCRSWAQRLELLDRKVGLYGKLRKTYKV